MLSIHHPPPHRRQGGFALVVVISLMVLIAVLSLGLLSLSSVSLRSSGQAADRAEARTNARLAVAMAIGQLQLETGPDTRITGPADFISPDAPGNLSHPAWRGVWQASSVRPRSYPTAREDEFSNWLVTGGGQNLTIDAARRSVEGEDVVIRRLAGEKDVRVPLLGLPDDGRLAWWTDDESLKARADLAAETPSTPGEETVVAYAAPRSAPEAVPGVSGFDPGSHPGRLVTTGQLALAADEWPRHPGLDFTPYSRSVLANVRDGGLKQDLSSLLELEADRITGFGQWTGSRSINSAKAYLYGPPGAALGARWNHLHAYYNLYKDITFNGDEPTIEPSDGMIDWHLADQQVDFGDEAGGFRFPRLAKIIYVFSYSASRTTGAPREGSEYTLEMVTDIFVTLWNPFDVRINFPSDTTFYAKFSKGLPLRFDWRVGGRKLGEADLASIVPTGGFLTESQFFNPGQGRQFTMGPGETVVFSIENRSDMHFRPGVYFDGGVTSDTLLPGGQKITGSGNDQVSVGLVPAQNSLGYTADGQGNSQYLDFWIYDTARGWPFYEHRGEILARADAPFLRQMEAVEPEDVPSVTFSNVVGRKQPFGAFIMETKTARDSRVPIAAFLNSGTTRLSSRLTGNPDQFVNERLEYKLEPVTGFDSDIIQVSLPSHPAGPDHGFIGSGRGPGSGQTHFLFSAVPTAPPTSLAQFRHAGVGDGASTLRATHWDFNSTPTSPYADQSIGNSYGHPLIPPTITGKREILDHRHQGNEALWDPFFLSSLAPRGGERFGEETPMWQTWKSFVEGNGKLLNTRFSYWRGAETGDEAFERCFGAERDESLLTDAYHKIAAKLLLEGGFNINSTSVAAWQALLGSTRGRTITRLPLSGRNRGSKMAASGALYSRTRAVLAGSVDGSPGDLASHYAGYRDLSEEQVTDLAEAIVDQVRRRGPFLNLAEFINRRPTGDTELAVSGALQSAIDECGLNDAVAAGGSRGSGSPGGVGMPFSEASALNTATGNTGWLMQADLLDPLGPSLVARGDTFRIRGYGESRNRDGSIAARAWCEAVVQRVPDFVDGSDDAADTPTSPLNQRFGRNYELVNFRWLHGPEEG